MRDGFGGGPAQATTCIIRMAHTRSPWDVNLPQMERSKNLQNLR